MPCFKIVSASRETPRFWNVALGIFDSVETFYRRFYFRAGKIASIVGEMVMSPEMMARRLREGVEFFRFLREREMAH